MAEKKAKWEKRDRRSLRDDLLEFALYKALVRTIKEGGDKPYDLAIRLMTELGHRGLQLTLAKGTFDFWKQKDKNWVDTDRVSKRKNHFRQALAGKRIEFYDPESRAATLDPRCKFDLESIRSDKTGYDHGDKLQVLYGVLMSMGNSKEWQVFMLRTLANAIEKAAEIEDEERADILERRG